MAAVDLETVLLSNAADLSVTVELEVVGLSESPSSPGAVKTYANGRQRSVTRAGTKQVLALEFEVLNDRPTLELIRAWRGQLVLYRDPRGRKVWGTFYDLQITENISVDYAAVGLALNEVTYDEGV
jgi:hypothetical protein